MADTRIKPGEFEIRVHRDEPEDVLKQVVMLLEDGSASKALSRGLEYFSAKNAQAHVNGALAAYKKHIGEGGS